MTNETSVLWQQTLEVLKKLGAPEPAYSKGYEPVIANFTKDGRTVGIDVRIGAGNVGVVATDLFRHGIITLSKDAAALGGVFNQPLQNFTPKVIESLVGTDSYPHEKFGLFVDYDGEGV